MKANELMIGDWVKFPTSDLFHKVYAVQGKSVKIDKQYWHKADNLEPVPLTAEILEKNGWLYQEYPDDEKFIWPVDNEIEMPFWLLVGMDGNRYWVTVGICELMCPINYVHELQHALRLCGVEKEIEL